MRLKYTGNRFKLLLPTITAAAIMIGSGAFIEAIAQATTGEQQRAERLAKAESDVAAAKANENQDPVNYILALDRLAFRRQIDARSLTDASQTYLQAFTKYESLPPHEQNKVRIVLWEHIGLLPATQFDRKFAQFYRDMLSSGTETQCTDCGISTAWSTQGQLSKKSEFDRKKFLKNALDTRTSLKGKTDPNLDWILHAYGSSCEQTNQLDVAESMMKWRSTLNFSQPDRKERLTIELASFYQRHNMSAKCRAIFPSIEQQIHPGISTLTIIELVTLAEQCRNAGDFALTEKIVKDLLTVGGKDVVTSNDFQSLLQKMVDGYINGMQLPQAQNLLKQRIAAAQSYAEDRFVNFWRFKLSNLDLALGETAESDKLFAQAKIKAALAHDDIDKVIEARDKLVKALKAK